MLVGMVVVFAFLTLLIGGVKLIAYVCQTFPGEENVSPTLPQQQSTTTELQPNHRVVAAIAAAISQHRQQNK